MPSQEMTVFGLLRYLFSRLCFCIGLGTATYFSYIQVRNWNEPKAEIKVLDSKIAELNGQQPGGTTAHHRFHAFKRVTSAQLAANPAFYSAPVKVETPHVEQASSMVAAASPSPSPSPAAEGAPAMLDASASPAQPIDPNQLPPPEQPIMPYGMAYYAPMTPERNLSSDANQQQPAMMPAPMGGMVASHTSSSAPSPASGTGSSSANHYANSGSSGSSGSSNSAMSESDIQFAKGAIQAMIPSVNVTVGGNANGAHGNFLVSNLRWDANSMVLPAGATFSLAPPGGGSTLYLNAKFTVQGQTTQDVVISSAVSSSHSQNDTRNGKNVRVIDITFGNPTVMNGSVTLMNVHVVLVQDLTTQKLTEGSMLSFTREHVQTLGSDPANPNAQIPVDADSILFSMTLLN